MDGHDARAEREPIAPSIRPLIDEGQDTSFAAAGGGGFLALAFARGLRTSGWTRTVSIVLVLALALGALAILLALLF